MTSMRAPSIWDDRTLGPDAALLHGRHAVVTGAAQGIGRATALALARFGCDLAICDRQAEGLADTARAVQAIGQGVLTAELDVRDAEGVVAFRDAVADTFGTVEILVNNAGGTFVAPFMDVSEKGEMALIRENFTQVACCIRSFVPLMAEGGSVINVTSIEAHRAGPLFGVYSAMKAAVANLTRTLSMELAERSIRVNCIAPDVIPTPGDEAVANDSDILGLPVATQSLPEGGRPEDCAAAAVFLAGDMARFITGSTIHVDGGTMAAGGWKIRDDGSFSL